MKEEDLKRIKLELQEALTLVGNLTKEAKEKETENLESISKKPTVDKATTSQKASIQKVNLKVSPVKFFFIMLNIFISLRIKVSKKLIICLYIINPHILSLAFYIFWVKKLKFGQKL